MCPSASTAVLANTEDGAFSIYFPSTNARTGKIIWLMLCFVFRSSLVKIAYGVTSEPVPQVVGTAITGRCRKSFCWYSTSSVLSLFWIISAIALAASNGEPPPTPITKSVPSARPSSAAFIILPILGFSSILSKIT